MQEFDFKKAKKMPHSEVDLVVVDLGDSWNVVPQARKMLKGIGKRVYLRVPEEELARRLKNDRNRPLLMNNNPDIVVQGMLKERGLLYEQAECIIDTTQRSPHQIATEIAKKLCNADHDRNF